MKYLLKLLKSILRQNKHEVERLYYLDGIKRIEPNKYTLNECTVTK